MKILLINGSPHKDGTTARALQEAESIFRAEGAETELIHVGNKDVRGCIDCQSCKKTGKCAIDDIVNETAEKFRDADGILVGSPVYFASPNGTVLSFLDRLFYSTHFPKTGKVGAAVVCARRAGTTASFDVLNKYFTISGMPVASGQYWNAVHGNRSAEQAEMDAEGLQQMRTMARNMVFLIRSVKLGEERFGLPEKEDGVQTNFIR